MLDAKKACRVLVSDLYGDEGSEAFEAMPVRMVAGGSQIDLNPVQALVRMSIYASPLCWLHETAHYLSWLWSRGELMDAARRGHVARVEAAAILPHVKLAGAGRPDALAYLRGTFDCGGYNAEAVTIAIAAEARRRTVPLRELGERVLRRGQA